MHRGKSQRREERIVIPDSDLTQCSCAVCVCVCARAIYNTAHCFEIFHFSFPHFRLYPPPTYTLAYTLIFLPYIYILFSFLLFADFISKERACPTDFIRIFIFYPWIYLTLARTIVEIIVSRFELHRFWNQLSGIRLSFLILLISNLLYRHWSKKINLIDYLVLQKLFLGI